VGRVLCIGQEFGNQIVICNQCRKSARSAESRRFIRDSNVAADVKRVTVLRIESPSKKDLDI
jgi:hypothetical protein